MSLQEKLIKIAKFLTASNRWEKFDSSSVLQGWRREKVTGGYEYRYQDNDPNEEKDGDFEKFHDRTLEKALASGEFKKVKEKSKGNITFLKNDFGLEYKVETFKGPYADLKIKNALLANSFYYDFFGGTPYLNYVVFEGKKALVSTSHNERQATKEDLIEDSNFKKGFLIDSFLGNLGVLDDPTKININEYGNFIRGNLSNVLLFDREGNPKKDFSTKVTELHDLKDSSKTELGAKIFGTLKNQDFLKMFTNVRVYLTDDSIAKKVRHVFSKPEEEESAEKLIKYLIARKNVIMDYIKKIKQDLLKNAPKRSKNYFVGNKKIDASLTEDEIFSIKSYTGIGYEKINQALREGDELEPNFDERVSKIVSGIAKLPIYEHELYRGMGLDESSLAFVMKLKPGDVVYSKGFLSTSSKKDVAETFGSTIQFVIKGKTGRDLEGYGPASEHEVLFSPDSRFVVKDIQTIENGFLTIKMEEILPDEMKSSTPVNFGEASKNPEDIRKFLLRNPKLTQKQRERIMKLTPNELMKVFFAILSKGKSGKDTVEDKFNQIFL